MMGQITGRDQEVFDALKYRIDIDTHGTRRYYNRTGCYHRDEGPAVEYATGTKYWWQNGKLHRTDGPAIECVNGHKEWWQNGQRHRTDGPAIEYADGRRRWCVNDKKMTEAEFNLAVKRL